MVLKASKCGLNTGNTIRKGHRRFYESNSNVIGRTGTISFSSDISSDDIDLHLQKMMDFADEKAADFDYGFNSLFHDVQTFLEVHLDMFEDTLRNFPMSLDKAKRWLWPELLKEQCNILKSHCHHESIWLNMGFIPEIACNGMLRGERVSHVNSKGKPSHQTHQTRFKPKDLRKTIAKAKMGLRGVQRKPSSLPGIKRSVSPSADIEGASSEPSGLTPPRSIYTIEKRPCFSTAKLPLCSMRSTDEASMQISDLTDEGTLTNIQMSDLKDETPLTNKQMSDPKDYWRGKKSLKKSKGLKNKHIYSRTYALSHEEITHGTVASLVESPKRFYKYVPEHLRPKRQGRRRHNQQTGEDKPAKDTGFFLTETPENKADFMPHKEKKRDKRDQEDESQRRTTEVTLWEFIDMALHKPTEQKTIELEMCTTGMPCSTGKTAAITQPSYVPHPPEKPRDSAESIPGIQLDKAASGTCVRGENGKQAKRKNNMGKRRRDKIKRRTNPPETSAVGKEQTWQPAPMPHLLVKLKSASTKPGYLLKTFGERFKESSTSSPRKFWIDMSGLKTKKDDGHEKGDKVAQRILTVLLFESVPGAPLGNGSADGQETFKIYPKLDLSTDEAQTLVESMRKKIKPQVTYPTPKVVDYYHDFLKSLLHNSPVYEDLRFGRRHCQAVGERLLSRMDWLYSLCEWKFSILSAREAYPTLKHTCDIQRPSSAQLRPIIHPKKDNIICDTCLTSQYNAYIPLTDLPEHSSVTSASLPAHARQTASFVRIKPFLHTYCLGCFRAHLDKKLANAEIPLTCPGHVCNTILDPVTLLSGMTMKSYNTHLQRCLDQQVTRHPQWQWCPNSLCGRAVKLLGSALLDSAVVIQCVCGHAWCFHCLQRAHWPASCSQAKTYLNLRENDTNAIAGGILKTMPCTKCSTKNVQEENTDEICSCSYLICTKCFNLSDSPVEIPKALIQEKVVSLEGSFPVLFPLLMYRSARVHGEARTSWNQTAVEIKANSIVRLIKRSKYRHGSTLGWSHDSVISTSIPGGQLTAQSRPGGRPAIQGRLGGQMAIQGRQGGRLALQGRPGPSNTSRVTATSWGGLARAPTSLNCLNPSLETEKIFLILVQHFLYQAHFLLENVYAMLLQTSTSDKARTTISLVLKLERVVDTIETMLSSLQISPSQMVLRLKKLMDSGKKIVMEITTSIRTLQSLDMKRNNTVLPVGSVGSGTPLAFPKPAIQIRSVTKS